MNNRVNYTGFIDMFLESEDDYEPYGVIWDDEIISERAMSHELYSNVSHYLHNTE